MRWVTFTPSGHASERTGMLVDGRIHACGPGVTLLSLLTITTTTASPHEGDDLRSDPHDVFELDAVQVLAPIPHPPTVRDFYAFEQHVRTARQRRGLEMDPDWYELPVFYFSNPYAITGPDDDVAIPPGSAEMDYELEVAAVVGVAGADLDPDEAERSIAGYCVMNDWSARDIQRREMKLSMGPVKGKDFATSLGPVFVTPDELEDTRRDKSFDLAMTASVNGVEYSRASLADIFWSFGEMIAYASRGTRVETGDIIGSGTCGTGCILELSLVHGADRYPWLQPGDVVELSVERLGTLRNRVVTGDIVATTAMNTTDDYLARLDAVESRLGAAAGTEPPPGSLTGADAETGERWERGQVWAHVSEFIPYWIAQAAPVLNNDNAGEPVPFGRTKRDPERIGAIERNRNAPVPVLWDDTRADIAELRAFLGTITPEQWALEGRHPTLGPMTVEELVEEFLVGHLEEHADQLEGMIA